MFYSVQYSVIFLKAELKKKYEQDELPNSLKLLENILVKNGGVYFVGKQVVTLTGKRVNFC